MQTQLLPNSASFASLMKCIELYEVALLLKFAPVSVIIDKDTGKCKYLTVKYDEKIKNQCFFP